MQVVVNYTRSCGSDLFVDISKEQTVASRYSTQKLQRMLVKMELMWQGHSFLILAHKPWTPFWVLLCSLYYFFQKAWFYLSFFLSLYFLHLNCDIFLWCLNFVSLFLSFEFIFSVPFEIFFPQTALILISLDPFHCGEWEKWKFRT